VRQGEQLAVAVGQLADLGGELDEGVAVGLQQVVPRGGGVLGVPIDRPFLGDPLSFRTGLRGAGRFDSL
jgi:hypothetical protein